MCSFYGLPAQFSPFPTRRVRSRSGPVWFSQTHPQQTNPFLMKARKTMATLTAQPTLCVAGRVKSIAGGVLHFLVGGLMTFAGLGKLLGFAPPEVVEAMQKYGLSGQLQLIGAGELTAALLLWLPRTSSLGVLLTSSFWGGVICIHMSHGEPYLMPSIFLVLTWVGGTAESCSPSSFFAGLSDREHDCVSAAWASMPAVAV